jgi:signal transduction histidine kinase
MRQPDDVGVEVALGDVSAHDGAVDPQTAVFDAPIIAGGSRRGGLTIHDRSGVALLAEEEALVQTVAETLSLWKERHRAARALQEANERLTDANQALEAASQLKDDLLSMASHELRTPLTPIIGFLEVLQARHERLSDEQKLRLVGVMRTHATRMLRLVDDLLIVSRATAQVLESRPEDVWADDVLAPVLGELGDLGGTPRGVHLAVEGCRLHVDPQHLQQIVFNLVSNAMKYGEPPVTIQAVRHGEGRVALEVADHGPGVPPSFRDRMWDRFEQKDRGDTRTARGTGLGLAIVKLLTEANGGTVGYRDAVPQGAVFSVVLTGRVGELPSDGPAATDRPLPGDEVDAEPGGGLGGGAP